MELYWNLPRMEALEQDIKSGLFSGNELMAKTAELTKLWQLRTKNLSVPRRHS